MRVSCHHCGTPGHLAAQCGKKGHLAKVCRSTPKPQQDPTQVLRRKRRSAQPVRGVEEDSEKSSEDEFVNTIGSVRRGSDSPPPIKVQVGVDDRVIGMEVDTGASVTIMAESTYKRYEEVFQEGLGIFRGCLAKIVLVFARLDRCPMPCARKLKRNSLD